MSKRKKFTYIIKIDIKNLPDDLLWEVLLFLPIKDIFNIILAQKRVYSLTTNDNFWKDVFRIKYPKERVDYFLDKLNWKTILKLKICNTIGENKFYVHPRNKHLTFDEKRHIYYVEEKTCNYSVSKVVGKFTGEFDKNKKINEIIERKKNGTLWKTSIYYDMNAEQIGKFWDQRRDDGTYLHNLIERYIRIINKDYGGNYVKFNADYVKVIEKIDINENFYNQFGDKGKRIHTIYEPKESKFYKDYQKFIKFYKKLRSDGWLNFIPEMQTYADNPFMGGMVDLIVYRKNIFTKKYEYMVIDWKRSRLPEYKGTRTLDYIVQLENNKIILCSESELIKEGNIYKIKGNQKKIHSILKSPLYGKQGSTHLKHSLQIYIYIYVLEKYYAKDYFLFKPGQLVKAMNVYYNDKYESYYEKECINLKNEVKEIFEMINNGFVKIV